MNDAEWLVTEPLLPLPAWRWGRGGRPEKHCRRTVVDAIRYVVDNGCKWRALPADFPPHPTVYAFFVRWERARYVDDVHDALRGRLRGFDGREAEPAAAVIDSQSVRAAETVGAASRGWVAGKKVGGRKRHIAVDTLGLLLVVWVTAASVQDRDGARPLLTRLRQIHCRITLVWADGGYAGKLVTWAKGRWNLTLDIVRRSDDAQGFIVLPRRWVVERSLSWICRRRRCVRDCERLPGHHEAMVKWSMIIFMTRRLARQTTQPHHPQ
ncbi:IS5 family transposase [Streptomyces sp. NBC_00233]|uniref:IS5 family transposase n=1 Tax=Streptomyces sp. NBC_00233 TaxID=2975686 RepID=UPI0022572FF0|nr:IS5 family transposase [Streptomyces sp. NBC_00233]MCX5233302.1 IS5 family transposase [Streptomyces sp. NBC_00233]